MWFLWKTCFLWAGLCAECRFLYNFEKPCHSIIISSPWKHWSQTWALIFEADFQLEFFPLGLLAFKPFEIYVTRGLMKMWFAWSWRLALEQLLDLMGFTCHSFQPLVQRHVFLLHIETCLQNFTDFWILDIHIPYHTMSIYSIGASSDLRTHFRFFLFLIRFNDFCICLFHFFQRQTILECNSFTNKNHPFLFIDRHARRRRLLPRTWTAGRPTQLCNGRAERWRHSRRHQASVTVFCWKLGRVVWMFFWCGKAW